MPQIGIFWFYKNTVIGKSIDLKFADILENGTFDSPDTHADLWDNNHVQLHGFPELNGTEYFQVPRGRVFWMSKMNSARILMDSVLFNQTTKLKILKFFDLEKVNTVWNRDGHYTTDWKELDAMFGD